MIQGSASVYGRKVEYLHNLVYAALDAIANKRCGQITSVISVKEEMLHLDIPVSSIVGLNYTSQEFPEMGFFAPVSQAPASASGSA